MQQKKRDRKQTRRWSNYRQVSYITASIRKQVGAQKLKEISTQIFAIMKANENSFSSEKAHMLVVKQAEGYFRGQKIIDKKEQQKLIKSGGKTRPVTYIRDKQTNKILKRIAPLVDIPHPDQVGFTANCSIWDAASRMAECSAVVNIDLENAFNAIPEGAVYLIFRKVFDLNKTHAAMLTDACCENGFMYQGCPLSPLIFNLWTRPILDSIKGAGFKIVAYADDLTIGTECGYISHKMVRVFKKWIEQFNMTVNTAKVKFYNYKKTYKETVGLKKWCKDSGLIIEPLKFRKALRKLAYLAHLYDKGVTHTRRLNKAGEPNELGFVILGMWIWISESKRRGFNKRYRKLYKRLQKRVPAILDDWKSNRQRYPNLHSVHSISIPHSESDIQRKWKEIYGNLNVTDIWRATNENSEKLIMARFKAVQTVDPMSTARKNLRTSYLHCRIDNRYERALVNSSAKRTI